MPLELSSSRALLSSSSVVFAKRLTLMYPISSSIICAAITLNIGILSRSILNSNRSLSPSRLIKTLTRDPLGPFNNLITSLLVTPTPATYSSSTCTILSPALMPNLSEGPPAIGETTIMVSLKMLN